MDDKELKKLLEENLKVSKETLSIAKSLNRARIWGNFFFFIKWGIIFAVLIFGFVKLQPYLQTFSNNIDRLSQLISEIANLIPGQ